jgi:MarR family transcriptional regulator, lower aerobic nicotinate degradation pathway regulator
MRARASTMNLQTRVDTRRRDVATQRPPHAEKNNFSSFVLEEQVGFLLRAASQRNTVLFSGGMVAGLTRVQFATMAKLLEIGFCSQNELGRLVLMDRATIKGVVSRLRKRGFIQVRPDVHDRRQHVLALTELGQRIARRAIAVAPAITDQMLERLNAAERKQIVRLLRKMVTETGRL